MGDAVIRNYLLLPYKKKNIKKIMNFYFSLESFKAIFCI